MSCCNNGGVRCKLFKSYRVFVWNNESAFENNGTNSAGVTVIHVFPIGCQWCYSVGGLQLFGYSSEGMHVERNQCLHGCHRWGKVKTFGRDWPCVT